MVLFVKLLLCVPFEIRIGGNRKIGGIKKYEIARSCVFTQYCFVVTADDGGIAEQVRRGFEHSGIENLRGLITPKKAR